jgi:hypothetical protein
MTKHTKPHKPSKPSQWLLPHPHHAPRDYTAHDHLRHLLTVARPTDYREALLELYHSYVEHHHDALPLDFGEMAHRVNVLCEFFKALSGCDLKSGFNVPSPAGKRRPKADSASN